MSRHLASLLLVISGVVILSTGCGRGGDTLVKVGGEKITEGDLELLVRVNPRLKPRLATPSGKQKVLENYVEQELFYQESARRGIQRSKDVKEKLQLYEKIIVAQALLDDELNSKVKEYYDNHRDEFERMKISHILVRTASPESAEAKVEKSNKKAPKRSEAEALKLVEQIRGRLAKNEDFGQIAKELSEDERTKGAQGDLGYITLRDKRLERWGWLSLAEKAFSMKIGEFSDSIKTKDGFHIIKATEDKKLQPFEEAEAPIKFRLQSDIRTGLLEDLKKKYKVEYAKAPAGEAPPAQVPTPEATPPAEGEPATSPSASPPPPPPQSIPVSPPTGNQ